MPINDDILDAAVRHQVYIGRYGTGVVKKTLAMLKDIERELIAEIAARDPTAVAGSWSRKRLESLLQEVRRIIISGHIDIGKATRKELVAFAKYEAEFQGRMINNQAPVEISTIAPSAQQLYAAVTSEPFKGRLLSEWVDGMATGTYNRVRDELRQGFVQGETIEQMIQRIRGTAKMDFTDGVMEISRRGAEAMVRTATQFTANVARRELYKENSDLIEQWRFTAVLDSRTTVQCAALDGQVLNVGEGPEPPLHINCRSTMVPIVKSWKELGIDIEEAPKGTRASMDGQVPSDVTYSEWFKRQSAEFQDDVLGSTKGALYREGGLTLDKFVDMKSGKPWSLEDLRKREEEAFERAGL